MTTMMATPSDVFDNWAGVYDEQPNPLLALEHRYLTRMLPGLNGLDILDAGCGTGRWLQFLASQHPASLVGVDSSSKMLQRASAKLGTASNLRLGSCLALPIQNGAIDLVLASFVISYVEDIEVFAREVHRVTRPGANVFFTDMHQETAMACNWKRAFNNNGTEELLQTYDRTLLEIIEIFQTYGFELISSVEPAFDLQDKPTFEQNGKLDSFNSSANLPAIYILHLRKQAASTLRPHHSSENSEKLTISGASYALGPDTATSASVAIERGYVRSITSDTSSSRRATTSSTSFDLSGYLLLPGLINAHDHLEFGLFPNLGAGPYQNSVEWAKEIHRTHAALIARHRRVPRAVRLWWGAIRNLLCGVTTVCHHNPLSRELLSSQFPVRVLSKFGWAHSLEMDPNLIRNFDHTPPNLPFILHAAEGIDARSAQEIFDLDRMQVLDDRTVLVHGLAMNPKAIALLNRRRSAVIICPTSNQFLFHCTPSSTSIRSINTVVLGSDSPLTSAGDLLDEIDFARNEIGLDINSLYEMVTAKSANILRLRNGEGQIKPGSIADLIAVRNQGLTPAETVASLTFDNIELVMLGGRVQLVNSSLYARLPDSLKSGLQSLTIDGHLRWLRAPVENLITEARKVLGRDLRLGGKKVDHASAA
ncbi:MAG TPA: methyltransferase domain-containing protein [Edaphobacter sp.]|jgi:ubiquinone/menaquinone biosynthesis C-methylase UbiE/cytosine/adenosine deaminase-related metal-dependent hydrolase|nr:methyltransferase domain-containing protein [Edaphobacter sp.]